MIRESRPADVAAIQALWERSLTHDEPGSWPRGGWSASAWATASCILVRDERVVGVAGVRAEAGEDSVVPIRIALDLDAREPPLAKLLVAAAVDLARESGGRCARLWVPTSPAAAWAQSAARDAQFASVRSVAHMLLPAETPMPRAVPLEEVRIRAIREAEEHDVLAALNRAWAGTWGFVPIPLEMFERDLDGQREGMLLGVNRDDRIVATCHAVYEPREQNPDGQPRAWISNLTVDPDFRQRGLARAMLSAGIDHLRQRGATSITLGVDAGNPAPMRLYLSAGFQVVSSVEAWDKPLD